MSKDSEEVINEETTYLIEEFMNHSIYHISFLRDRLFKDIYPIKQSKTYRVGIGQYDPKTKEMKVFTTKIPSKMYKRYPGLARCSLYLILLPGSKRVEFGVFYINSKEYQVSLYYPEYTAKEIEDINEMQADPDYVPHNAGSFIHKSHLYNMEVRFDRSGRATHLKAIPKDETHKRDKSFYGNGTTYDYNPGFIPKKKPDPTTRDFDYQEVPRDNEGNPFSFTWSNVEGAGPPPDVKESPVLDEYGNYIRPPNPYDYPDFKDSDFDKRFPSEVPEEPIRAENIYKDSTDKVPSMDNPMKKPRGRPKGSVKTPAAPKVTKPLPKASVPNPLAAKRGRPKGSRNKPKDDLGGTGLYFPIRSIRRNPTLNYLYQR